MKDRSDFQDRLHQLFEERTRAGAASLTVSASELYRLVCGKAGEDPRMPVCCAAMRAQMRPNDRVIFEPPKGKGAGLSILYRLPRSVSGAA